MFEDDFDNPFTGIHNPTVYGSREEMEYFESHMDEVEESDREED